MRRLVGDPVERANLAGVVIPFVGTLVAIVMLLNRAVDSPTCSYGRDVPRHRRGDHRCHRLLTHRAFASYPWVERTFAVMGSLSVQGSVMD